MYNKAILMGHVGKDPAVRQAGDSKVARFTLATYEAYKDKNGERQKTTTWHNIVAWGKWAEVIEKNVRKGTGLHIEGKIVNRSYEADGVKKYVSEVRLESMQFLPSGNKDNQLPPENMPPQPDDDLPY